MFATPLRAQLRLDRFELGLNIGGMNYIGDLNDQSMLGKPLLGYGGYVRYKLDNRWAVTLSGAYGTLEGGNPDIIERRNLSFRSYLAEAGARCEFNFLPLGDGDLQWHWSPYIFGGISLFAFNPTAQYTDPLTGRTSWVALQPLGTEGQNLLDYPQRTPYSLVQLAMPFGLGFKFMLSKTFSFSVEYGFRKTWTDYIDDVSTTYVNLDALRASAGEEAAALSDRSSEVVPGFVNAAGVKRGDSSLNDWYAYFNCSVSINFDAMFGWMKKKQCDR